jgi:hypothetical protein
MSNQRTINKNQLNLFVMFVTLLLIGIMSARTPLDSDMWWHLRAGEETVLLKKPLVIDMFSYTRYGEAWVNHGWLSQVLMYLLYRYFSFPGLCLFVSFFAVVSFYFVYKNMEGCSILKAFLIILGGIAASYTWSPRPQIISQALLAGLSLFMYSLKKSKKNIIWCLPILFIIWGNLHGGYVVGLIYIGCFLIGECVNHFWLNDKSGLLTWKEIAKISLVTILSFALVLVNPNGIETWLIPFKTVSLLSGISEWESPDFHDPGQQVMLWLVLLLLVAIFLSKKPKDAKGLLTTVAMLYLALMYRRNFGVCAVILIPEVSRHLHSVIVDLQRAFSTLPGEIGGRFRKFTPTQNGEGLKGAAFRKYLNLFIIAILGVVAFSKIILVSSDEFMQFSIPGLYPKNCIEYLRENQNPGRLFNEYDWGGFLTWELRDQLVFMDARADLFGDEIISQWMNVTFADQGWDQILNKWEVAIILIKPDRPVVPELLKAGWEQVYIDPLCTIMRRE